MTPDLRLGRWQDALAKVVVECGGIHASPVVHQT